MKIQVLLLKVVILYALLATAGSVQAERKARILYLGAPKSAPATAIVYQDSGTPQEIVLERHNFSLSFELKEGITQLSFLPEVLPEGEQIPEEAPILNIPKGWSRVLILVFVDQENPVFPVRFQAINASKNIFSPGEILFVNYTDATMSGTLGDKKIILEPQTQELVSNPVGQRGSYRVRLDLFLPSQNKNLPLTRQWWLHEPDVRNIVFVIPLAAPRHATIYSTPILRF